MNWNDIVSNITENTDIRSVAAQHGVTVSHVITALRGPRPDLYQRYMFPERHLKSHSMPDERTQNTSASPGHAHIARHKTRPGGNQTRTDSWKNDGTAIGSCPPESVNAPGQQTVCTFRIDVGKPGQLNLSGDLASDQVLQLRFASCDRNAGTHTSCHR